MLPNTPLKTFAAVAVLFLFSFACGGDFVIGMYGVDNPKDLKLVKQTGFNVFQTYNKDPQVISALAKEAKKQGLKIMAYPNNIINTPYAQQAKTWPIYAWYIIDEPDIFNTPFEKVKAKDEAAKAAFPDDKTAFVISQGFTKINYYKACDILMMDWYPVPHLALESLGKETAKAGAAMADAGVPQKPLISVVQAFDWKDFKQYRPDNDRIGRYPTAQEINFMSYHAVLSGAEGLFYFAFSEASKTPQKWAAMAETVKQFKYLSPVLSHGRLLPAPDFIKVPLMAQKRVYKGRTYLIVINPSDKPASAPKQILSNKYKTLFQTSNINFIVKQNDGNIPPYSAFVLMY